MAKSDRGYGGTISQPRTLRTIAVDKGADPGGLADGGDWDANAGMPKDMVKGKYDGSKANLAKIQPGQVRPSVNTGAAGSPFKVGGGK